MINKIFAQSRLSLLRPALLVGLSLTTAGCEWIGIASVSTAGVQSNGGAVNPSISADGRFVAFEDSASNLVDGVATGRRHIYLRDSLDGVTSLVSVGNAGNHGNLSSGDPSISADGRYVAFRSQASNLVADDTNGKDDIFVRDVLEGTTTRVSLNSAGAEANRRSTYPSISADGRYVAFLTLASNLVAGDDEFSDDVFVHDLATGSTERVSIDSSGNGRFNVANYEPSISANGRFVTFKSTAVLAAADTNGSVPDIYVHDRNTGATTLESVNSAGNQGNLNVFNPVLSGSGRFVAFVSTSSNLVPGDTNNRRDIFIRDRNTATTTRISVDSEGVEGNRNSDHPVLSGNARYVAFQSQATNLVSGDTNGYEDVFVHDRVTAITTRVSVGQLGEEGNRGAIDPAISSNGRYVTFETDSFNIVPITEIGSTHVVMKAIHKVKITTVVPNMLPIGATTSVTVSGSNFLAGAAPSLAGAELSNVVRVDQSTITMDVTPDAGVAAGAGSILVLLPGTGAGSLSGSSGICVNCVTFF